MDDEIATLREEIAGLRSELASMRKVLSVERIDVVEADGTLRLCISNDARIHGAAWTVRRYEKTAVVAPA